MLQPIDWKLAHTTWFSKEAHCPCSSIQPTGAIPATLGNLETLQRLDLSFNRLFGSIPSKIADAPLLQVLDVRKNTLSGNVPLENPNRPEAFGPQSKGLTPKAIPQSANVTGDRSKTKSTNAGLAAILAAVLITMLLVAGIFTFIWYRRRKQRIGTAFESSDSRISTDQYQVKETANRRSASPLISLEYSNGWDPMSNGQARSGFLQEIPESYVFNVDDVESATRVFSDSNLLGKDSFSATYRGILRDGSIVAIKRIAKTSCVSDEAEFLKGLKILTSLKHENLLRLRGFCCLKGRGECFLIYDYVSKGNLLQFLDVKAKTVPVNVLDWSTRFSIIKGIAKGIEYLHEIKGKKSALVHQNISAEKVLIDHHYTPLLSGSGLHKLLADDIIFSTLKASAAMGYLAPEYTTTGRFTDKSDIYAFGMLVFQIMSGKTRTGSSIRQGAELCKFADFVDANLDGKFSESEAVLLGKIALLCTHECASARPTIANVVQELSNVGSTH